MKIAVRDRHTRYFSQLLTKLPYAYRAVDTNRITLVHFAVQSLDLLDSLETVNKPALIEWIYSLQTLPTGRSGPSIQTKHLVAVAVFCLGVGATSGFAAACFYNASDPTFTTRDSIPWMYTCMMVAVSIILFKPGTGLYYYWKGFEIGVEKFENHVGFKGGSYLGARFAPTSLSMRFHYQGWEYDYGHIAMTYTALCTLASLGDDLSRVNRSAIISALGKLQRDDGSFQCITEGSERDMRFLYCACCISFMLCDWSGVDIPRATEFIKSCRSYDGGVGLIPGQEGHGGSTFCATASLKLMGKLDSVMEEDGWRGDLIHWCVSRQIRGMQGRPNKKEDTCYSYWIGGTLRLLDCDHLLDQEALLNYVHSCETDMGGFSKVFRGPPDLLHSFYSMAWLSLSENRQHDLQEEKDQHEEEAEFTLNELDCMLGMRKSKTTAFRRFAAQVKQEAPMPKSSLFVKKKN